MIRTEDVKEIPKYLWNETSSKEFALMPYEAHQALLDLSSPIKIIYDNEHPLLVAGLYRRSFLSTPYLWVLITARFRHAKPSALRAIVAVANEFAPRCETLVEQDNRAAERLARAFNFEPTDGTILMGNLEYRMYRRGK